MFIYYWGGASGTNWASCPEMTNVVSDYWQGLFYYDVPADVTSFLVKDSTGNVSKASNQSADIAISDYFWMATTKQLFVKAWVVDGNKRGCWCADNAPMSHYKPLAVLKKHRFLRIQAMLRYNFLATT